MLELHREVEGKGNVGKYNFHSNFLTFVEPEAGSNYKLNIHAVLPRSILIFFRSVLTQ